MVYPVKGVGVAYLRDELPHETRGSGSNRSGMYVKPKMLTVLEFEPSPSNLSSSRSQG